MFWDDIQAPEWKPFRFAGPHATGGSYLLHVPTGHFLEVEPAVHDHVTGEHPDPAVAEELREFAASLPRPPPRNVDTDIAAISLNMAQGCNLRCTYCFAGEGDYGHKGMMSFEVATAAIAAFAKDRKSFHVIFFGGEPMLAFDTIKRVVEWCETQACRITFGMTTNGTLLNEQKLAWLRDKKFALVWSYDGKGLQRKQRLLPDKKTGSEQIVERKLLAFEEKLKELKEFRLRSTITKQNIGMLEEAIVDTLTSKNFNSGYSRNASAFKLEKFEEADVDELGAILARVVDRFLEEGDYERLLHLGNLKGKIQSLHKGRTGGVACGAGLYYLTVSMEGGYYLCHRFNEDESERFGGIDEGLNETKLAEIRAARSLKKEPCASCWMRESCAGGCFHEHKLATGDKLTMDATFCKLQHLEMMQAVRVYTVLLQKAPHLLEAK